MANDIAPESPKTRIQRWYLHDSNMTERTARAGLDVNTVGFTFADGTETQVELSKLFGGSLPAPSVGRAAAAFGINTSAGNAANTAGKGSTVEETINLGKEAIEARLETFAEGRWTTERAEGGPRPSLFFDALKVFREQNGADTSDARMAALRAEFADADKRTAYLSIPQFKVVYLDLQHKRQLEAAAKKAAADGIDTGALLA